MKPNFSYGVRVIEDDGTETLIKFASHENSKWAAHLLRLSPNVQSADVVFPALHRFLTDEGSYVSWEVTLSGDLYFIYEGDSHTIITKDGLIVEMDPIDFGLRNTIERLIRR